MVPRQERRHHLQRAQLLLPLRQPGRNTAPRRAAQHAQTGCARRRRAAAHRSSPAPAQLPSLQRPARLLGAAVGLRGAPSPGRPIRGGRMRMGARWHAPRRPPELAHPTAARLPPSISPPPPLPALTCLVHVVAHHGSTHLQAPQVSVHPVRRGSAACRAPHHAPSSGLLSVSGPERLCYPLLSVCARGVYPCRVCAGDRRTDSVLDAPRARARGSRGRQRIRVYSNIICAHTHE